MKIDPLFKAWGRVHQAHFLSFFFFFFCSGPFSNEKPQTELWRSSDKWSEIQRLLNEFQVTLRIMERRKIHSHVGKYIANLKWMFNPSSLTTHLCINLSQLPLPCINQMLHVLVEMTGAYTANTTNTNCV